MAASRSSSYFQQARFFILSQARRSKPTHIDDENFDITPPQFIDEVVNGGGFVHERGRALARRSDAVPLAGLRAAQLTAVRAVAEAEQRPDLARRVQLLRCACTVP